jgi:hypothetical protein
MSEYVEVVLYGSLQNSLGRSSMPASIQLELRKPAPFVDVLDRLGIALGLVQLVMVNHRAVPKDVLIQPNDRLALFPREYPVYPDWESFWL